MGLGGGHAGHNGLRDIHSALGTPDYWRLRLGIGHPGDKSQVAHFVLKPPRSEEQTLIDIAIGHALDTLPDVLRGDFPDVYALLSRFFRQDPFARLSRR